MTHRLLRLCAALLALLAAPAFAAEAPAINAQSFELTPGRHDGTFVRSALPQKAGPAAGEDALAWTLGAGLHYARRSLVFANRSGPTPLVQTVLGDLWMLDLGAAVGWRTWTFEATLPVALVMRGGGPDLLGLDRPLPPAFGDLRLGARRHLLRRDLGDKGTRDFGAAAIWAAPTGADGSWLSNGGLRLDLLGLATWRHAGWQVDANLGLRLRPMSTLALQLFDPTTGQPLLDGSGDPLREDALAVGSEWVLQVSASKRWLGERLGTRVELQAKGALSPEATGGQTLADALVSADWRLQRGAWHVFAALGGAATSGYGASQVRLLAGARFDPGQLPRDTDGDGFDDRDDRCPAAAEDKDGWQDDDGCPEPDNDGDGVLDKDDRCPLVPEDKDGRDDADGCPDLDDDGDGIPDARDRCPTKAEDVDGFEDADGCPDPDNDGDGILDRDDLCPNAPETRNDFEDHDGCPDVKPAPLVVDEGPRLRVRGRITFVTGSNSLTPDGRKLVAAVADYVRSHKELKAFEVQVHTDDNGERKALWLQSRSRAMAVKELFVRLARLAPHQVKATGKGATQPIADNGTLEGRTRNRRVDFKILSRTAPPPTPKRPAQPKARPRRTPAGTPPAAGVAAPKGTVEATKSRSASAVPKAPAEPASPPASAAPAAKASVGQPAGRSGPPPARRTKPKARANAPAAGAPAVGAPGPPPARPSTEPPSSAAPDAGGPPPARPTP